MGRGEREMSVASASHCRGRRGCSMHDTPASASCVSLSKASAGRKAPLASTRISTPGNAACASRSIASSRGQGRNPTLSLRQVKPWATPSAMRSSMASASSIQMRQWMASPVSPRLKGVSNSGPPPARAESSAVSMPKRREGASAKASCGRQPALLTASQARRSRSSQSVPASGESAGIGAHSPTPRRPSSVWMGRRYTVFSMRSPREVRAGRRKRRRRRCGVPRRKRKPGAAQKSAVAWFALTAAWGTGRSLADASRERRGNPHAPRRTGSKASWRRPPVLECPPGRRAPH